MGGVINLLSPYLQEDHPDGPRLKKVWHDPRQRQWGERHGERTLLIDYEKIAKYALCSYTSSNCLSHTYTLNHTYTLINMSIPLLTRSAANLPIYLFNHLSIHPSIQSFIHYSYTRNPSHRLSLPSSITLDRYLEQRVAGSLMGVGSDRIDEDGFEQQPDQQRWATQPNNAQNNHLIQQMQTHYTVRSMQLAN